jgi:hypothetical protein
MWRPTALKLSPIEVIALGFGVVCLVLVAMQTIPPENVNFDAMWYHLRAAERYAVAGGMDRTPEGDLLLSLPQTASWLYTWAFCWPGGVVEDHVRLALLLELTTVFTTLATIPALVRALCPSLPRESTRLAWVAFFFFPTIFTYDTGIMGGADHVVALWSVTSILTWFHARRSMSYRSWALFGVQIASLLAKYSSIYVLIPLVLVVAVDWAWRFRKLRHWGPLVTALVALTLTTPYWLRNVIWYHNPVYPAAGSLFPSTPWNTDADAWNLNAKESTTWTEGGTAAHKLEVTARALFNYQIDLNTWGDMTGNQPITGVVYFLSLLCLPFISDRRRLLVLALIMHGGIAVWFNTHQHQMRYLTVLFAPMAAGVAAVAISLWRSQAQLAKAAVLLAAGYELIAFGDMPFRKTHRMNGGQSTVDIVANYLVRRGARSGHFGFWESVGAALPPNAKLLVHGVSPTLGLGLQTVTDVIPLQLGINYGRWGSESEILSHLRKMGVTHVAMERGKEQSDSVSGEALFDSLFQQLRDKKPFGGVVVGELPDTAKNVGGGVLYIGCGSMFRTGLYTLEALKVPITPWYHPLPNPEPLAETQGDWHSLLPRAAYVVRESDCAQPDPPGSEFTFVNEQPGWPKKLRHFVRTAGRVMQ